MRRATRSRLGSSGVKRTEIKSLIFKGHPDMGHNTVFDWKSRREGKTVNDKRWCQKSSYICEVYFLYWVPHIRWDTFQEDNHDTRSYWTHRVENWLNQEERWTNKPIKGIMTDQKNTWHANWFQGKHNLLCNALPRRTSDYWRPKVRDTWLANRGKWQI